MDFQFTRIFLIIRLIFQVSYQFPLNNSKRILDAVQVLLVSEMRSGSSVIGDMFNVNPEAFYMYEPLRAVENTWRLNAKLCFLNGTCLHSSAKPIYEDEIRNVFNCDLDRLNTATLADDFLHKSESTLRFSQCSHQNGFKELNIKNCLPKMMTRCMESRLKVVKSIRLRMNQVERLLDDFPNLKIIHIVRDPRAVLLSRTNLAVSNRTNMAKTATELCTRVLKDAEKAENLKKRFKSRIKTVYYEKFANTPLETINTLYKFFSFKVPDNVINWVRENTLNVNNKVSGTFSTSQRNAMATANRWRQEIDIEMAAMVDVHCKQTLQKLGYGFVSNEEALRNVSRLLLGYTTAGTSI